MLTVKYDKSELARVAVSINCHVSDYHDTDSYQAFTIVDPIWAYLNRRQYFWGNSIATSRCCFPFEPIPLSDLFGDTFHTALEPYVFSRKPMTSKGIDPFYDDQMYGSPLDPYLNLAGAISSVLNAPNTKVLVNQHPTRHRNLSGRGTVGMQQVPFTLVDFPYFGISSEVIRKYTPASRGVEGHDIPDFWARPDYTLDIINFKDVCDFIKSHLPYHFTISGYGYPSSLVISSLSYNVTPYSLDLFWHTDFSYTDSASTYYANYDNHYHSPGVILSQAGADPNEFDLFRTSQPIMSFDLDTNFPREGGSYTFLGDLYSSTDDLIFVGIPSTSPYILTSGVTSIEQPFSKKANTIVDSFCNSFDDYLFDLVALTCDPATACLNAIEVGSDPSYHDIKQVKVMVASGTSLLDKIQNAGANELLRLGLSALSRKLSGVNLLRYRSLVSDATNFIGSLEALGRLKNTPKKLFTSHSFRSYQIRLFDRPVSIGVHSEAYLYASPLDVLEILIGHEQFRIVSDLLTLYYSSEPLGRLLLMVINLRGIFDLLATREFLGLPIFFVHSFTIETPLTEGEVDTLGVSSDDNEPIKIRYYRRDVSKHLPVLRPSRLVSIVNESTVIHAVFSLVRRLASLLVR